MGANRRIPDDVRTAILADIQTGMSCHRAAKKHGVDPSTAKRIARTAGITRKPIASLAAATEARQIDMAAKRAELAYQFLEDIGRLRERAWAPYQVVTNGPDGAEVITLPLPPLRDVQSAYTSIGILFDKHLAAVRHDADPGADAARSMLGDLGRALANAAQQLDTAAQ